MRRRLCWCGHDISDHDIGKIEDSPCRAFVPSGTPAGGEVMCPCGMFYEDNRASNGGQAT